MIDQKYDPNCAMCRDENGRERAGVQDEDLCEYHANVQAQKVPGLVSAVRELQAENERLKNGREERLARGALITALRARVAALTEAMGNIAKTEQAHTYMMPDQTIPMAIMEVQNALRHCGDLSRAALADTKEEKVDL